MNKRKNKRWRTTKEKEKKNRVKEEIDDILKKKTKRDEKDMMRNIKKIVKV